MQVIYLSILILGPYKRLRVASLINDFIIMVIVRKPCLPGYMARSDKFRLSASVTTQSRFTLKKNILNADWASIIYLFCSASAKLNGRFRMKLVVRRIEAVQTAKYLEADISENLF